MSEKGTVRVIEFEGGDTLEETQRRADIVKEEMRKLGIEGDVTVEFQCTHDAYMRGPDGTDGKLPDRICMDCGKNIGP